MNRLNYKSSAGSLGKHKSSLPNIEQDKTATLKEFSVLKETSQLCMKRNSL